MATSITEVAPTWSVTVASAFMMVYLAHSFEASLKMVVHRFLKKLNEVNPSNENIATKLAEYIPSLSSFTAKPGVVLIFSGVVLVVSEMRIIPCLAPLKQPV